MRVYCSGPMTGCPNLNRPAFDAAEKQLTAQGHFVINPFNISCAFGTEEELAASFRVLYEKPTSSLDSTFIFPKITSLARAVMDADFAAIRSCDAIYLLRGWETSRGAKKELTTAIAYDLKIMLEESDKGNAQ